MASTANAPPPVFKAMRSFCTNIDKECIVLRHGLDIPSNYYGSPDAMLEEMDNTMEQARLSVQQFKLLKNETLSVSDICSRMLGFHSFTQKRLESLEDQLIQYGFQSKKVQETQTVPTSSRKNDNGHVMFHDKDSFRGNITANKQGSTKSPMIKGESASALEHQYNVSNTTITLLTPCAEHKQRVHTEENPNGKPTTTPAVSVNENIFGDSKNMSVPSPGTPTMENVALSTTTMSFIAPITAPSVSGLRIGAIDSPLMDEPTLTRVKQRINAPRTPFETPKNLYSIANQENYTGNSRAPFTPGAPISIDEDDDTMTLMGLSKSKHLPNFRNIEKVDIDEMPGCIDPSDLSTITQNDILRRASIPANGNAAAIALFSKTPERLTAARLANTSVTPSLAVDELSIAARNHMMHTTPTTPELLQVPKYPELQHEPTEALEGEAAEVTLDVAQVRVALEEEWANLDAYLTSQVTCEDINNAIEDINNFLVERAVDMHNAGITDNIVPHVTQPEMQEELCFGSKTKAVLLMLLKLKRITGNGKTKKGDNKYIPVHLVQ